jgi:hypothetical protein
MAEAVHAALVGPKRKKLRIYNHEFNVKPAQPENATAFILSFEELRTEWLGFQEPI